jgi:hypothetical protein
MSDEKKLDAAEQNVVQQIKELLESANLTKKELEDVKQAIDLYLKAIFKEAFLGIITRIKSLVKILESYLGRPFLYVSVAYLLLKQIGVI